MISRVPEFQRVAIVAQLHLKLLERNIETENETWKIISFR